MFRSSLIAVVVASLLLTVAARADLVGAFTGFDSVFEVGTSGLVSSYDADTRAGNPLSGATTSTMLADLGPDRVSYPNGVGAVPSPGGALGAHFDQGVLGLQISGDELTIQLATALDPLAGFYYSHWESWYGQGDLFVDVHDSAGVHHFALLNSWARDTDGDPLELNRDDFLLAREFHISGGPGSTSLEGHLVRIDSDDDVTLSGGPGSYHAGNAPDGLDLRAFARDGEDRGFADLTHGTVEDGGRTWYLQSWKVALADLSTDAAFDLGLHALASCGNDQIGAHYNVPEPQALSALLAALVLVRPRRVC